MPAIHEFKHRGKVLQFTDTDIMKAIDDKSNVTHINFMEACRRIILGRPVINLWSDREFEEIVALEEPELDKRFEFAMSSLVRDVYAI